MTGTAGSAGLSLTSGMLVGQSRELMALVTAQETSSRTKIISAPSVIATDSVPTAINVGIEVPTLSSQAASTGVQVGGNTPFFNTITNRNTGVTLQILAQGELQRHRDHDDQPGGQFARTTACGRPFIPTFPNATSLHR